VLLLGVLLTLVEQFGTPDPAWDLDYQAWATWPAAAYIEIQLWTDEPIGDYRQGVDRRNACRGWNGSD